MVASYLGLEVPALPLDEVQVVDHVLRVLNLLGQFCLSELV